MKRFAAVIILVLLFTYGIQAYAEDAGNITYSKAKSDLLSSNRTLKKMGNLERQAYIQYRETDNRAQGIDTEGMTVGGNRITYDNYTQMLLTKQKVLMPEIMKNDWISAKNNEKLTENKMVLILRDQYMGLASAYCDARIRQLKFNLAEKVWKENNEKYKKGIISGEEKEESDYNYQVSGGELDAALKSRDNSIRSFNSFLGVDINRKYSDVEFKETLNTSKLGKVDYYIDKALSERQEITSIQKSIELKQRLLGIMEKNQVNIINPQAKKDYANIVFDVQTLKTKLEKTRYDIEKEIRNAYVDVSKQSGNITTLKNSMDSQNRNLQKVSKQYDKGLVTAKVVEQLKIGVSEIENSYYAAVFNYNTKLMKLENAAGLGPAY